MEKTSGKEHKLLNRVEIGFQWKHDGKAKWHTWSC